MLRNQNYQHWLNGTDWTILVLSLNPTLPGRFNTYTAWGGVDSTPPRYLSCLLSEFNQILVRGAFASKLSKYIFKNLNLNHVTSLWRHKLWKSRQFVLPEIWVCNKMLSFLRKTIFFLILLYTKNIIVCGKTFWGDLVKLDLKKTGVWDTEHVSVLNIILFIDVLTIFEFWSNEAEILYGG